jgi:hypothetical protein
MRTFLLPLSLFVLHCPLLANPDPQWNTFLGSADIDTGCAIDVDGSGNVYVAGHSNASWGSPVNPHTGYADAFVAKLDSSGSLQWNTFLGSTDLDDALGITVDDSGNVYVSGYSHASWGSPANSYTGGSDTFVAKLDSSGALQWHTFMGCSSTDYGRGVTLDANGDVIVTGESYYTWGTPLRAHSGSYDPFIAKLGSNGILLWHTFLGGPLDDYGDDVAVGGSCDVYVTGHSRTTWGFPLSAHAGHLDVFTARLDSSGALLWNTFMGSTSLDSSAGLAVDAGGNAYVTGESASTWGSPVNAYAGGSRDTLVFKLSSDGYLQWNTFLGCSESDGGAGIALDSSGDVHLTGWSQAGWGEPVNAHSGHFGDAFTARLSGDGVLERNTFMGSAVAGVVGYGLALSESGFIHVVGESSATWGTPVRAHAGGSDAFVAQLGPEPGTAFCFANDDCPHGGLNPCPCNNDNDGTHPIGAGCAHGSSTRGAHLMAAGSASVTSDTLFLMGRNAQPNNSSLFFQARNDLNHQGLFLGDGIRCAGGGLVRLLVKVNDANGDADSSPVVISDRSSAFGHPITPGQTLYYQWWFRDTAAGPPCDSQSNTSNGYSVTWGP